VEVGRELFGAYRMPRIAWSYRKNLYEVFMREDVKKGYKVIAL